MIPRGAMSRRMLTIAGLALIVGLVTQAFGLDLAYSQTLTVTVWSSDEDPGVDPDWAGWDAIPNARVPLTAQQVTPPMGGGNTPSVNLQTVHSDGDLIVRISWQDATEDTSTGKVELFADATAIQFPASASSSVPAICMGQADGAVNIWHWRADSEAGVSALPEPHDGYVDRYADTSETYYPAAASGNAFATSSAVQNLLVGGFGTLTPADEQSVIGEGLYDNNGWAVVLRRSFLAPGADQPQFDVGQEIDVALAVWNGSEDDRNGIKSVSQFVRFAISDSAVPQTLVSDTGVDGDTPIVTVSRSVIGYVLVGLVGGAVLMLLLMVLVWFGVIAKSFGDND